MPESRLLFLRARPLHPPWGYTALLHMVQGAVQVLDADEDETGEIVSGPGCERKELT